MPIMPLPVDPRNEKDYDTYPYGTEPIPGDKTWVATKKKIDDGTGSDCLP